MPYTQEPGETDELEPVIRMWLATKYQIENITAIETKLKRDISAALKERGIEDTSGSLRYHLSRSVDCGDKTFSGVKLEKVIKRSIDEEVAEQIAKENGVYDRLFPQRRVFDPDEIYVLYQEDIIDDAHLAKMVTEESTYRMVRIKS